MLASKKLQTFADRLRRRKTLVSNFLSLSGAHVVNYVLPLLTVPYLVRVLEPTRYGIVVFVQSFVQYFVLLTDYGFNLSATTKISIQRNDRAAMSETISAICIIKFALVLMSMLLFAILVTTVDLFREQAALCIASFVFVLGSAFFPQWFFQGTESMGIIAASNTIFKVGYTAAIFVFVRTSSDYVRLAALNSASQILAALVPLYVMFVRRRVEFCWPGIRRIVEELREGVHVFVSCVAINLYTTSNTFVLGLVSDPAAVGYFNAGEKIVRAITGLAGPLSQSIYPHISQVAAKSRDEAVLFVRRVIRLMLGPAILASIGILLLAPFIGAVLLGERFRQSVTVIRILSPVPMVVFLSNMLGVQLMLNLGYQRAFSRIILTAGIVSVSLAYLLGTAMAQNGVSIAALVTELFVTCCMLLYLSRHGVHPVLGRCK